MTESLTVQDWNKIIEEKEVDLLIEIENMIDQAFEKKR